MNDLLKPARWTVSAVVVFVCVLALHASDALHRWNDLLVEKYALWSQHDVASDLVVIGIDAQSLAELKSWPWPRSNHAKVLDFLRNASAARVFVDIDFSSPSRPAEDAALSEALSRWSPDRIVLPLFLQSSSGSNGTLVLTRPLPQFAERASLASVNLVPDKDSIVRVAQPNWDIDGSRVPSVLSTLSQTHFAIKSMPIDFSISPASFSYYSYADILYGRVTLEELRGKTVLIGAAALELGDMQPVPVYRSLPGVVIHALATQTARVGPILPLPYVMEMALIAAWTLLFAWLMRRSRWTLNLVLAGFATLVAVGVGIGAYLLRMRIDTLPLLMSTAGIFVAATLASVDAADLRASILSRLANKRRAVLDSVFASSYDGILWVDEAGTIISANSAMQALLGIDEKSLVGRHVDTFIAHQFLQASTDGLATMNGRILEGELIGTTVQSIPVEISTTLAEHDDGRQFTMILRDLRERRRQEARLQHQATHDALTGLTNRFRFMEELERRTQGSSETTMTLLSLSLARFKEVNDTLGHEAGDTVLCAVSHRLESVMAARGMIARMDGDSFAIIADCGGSRDKLMEIVHDLGEALRRPFEYAGIPIGIGANIGIARYPADGADGNALLKNASVAMYAAKRSGEDQAFYDASADQHSVRRLAMVGELRGAIENDSLELHYQPKVALRTDTCDSAEALLRWNHPVYGFISPGELIPLVESTEMLRPLTEWTIRRALRQQADWAHKGIRIRVAVNLSARLLQDLNFPARLAQMLGEHGISPGPLELEITESAMLHDGQRALAVGRGIRELGVPLSIDDYGTGHSSLAYLRDLSVSTLKLDRTFIEELEHSRGNRFIVESTIALAHALKLDVVAEGIETRGQAEYLRNLGYDYGQGYYFSKALAADAFQEWITARNARQLDDEAQVA